MGRTKGSEPLANEVYIAGAQRSFAPITPREAEDRTAGIKRRTIRRI
ncbi:hypothetical protein [Bacillus altitudinis]